MTISHRLAHRGGRSSQATPAAVDKSLSASHTKNLTPPVGLLTPPFGVAVFVIKATLDDRRITITDIFRGALPFAGIVMLTLLLIIIFPRIATGILGRF